MNGQEFQNKAMRFMPPWAWAIIAIMLGFSVALRLSGIDFSTPLNRIMNAKAMMVEKQSENGSY